MMADSWSARLRRLKLDSWGMRGLMAKPTARSSRRRSRELPRRPERAAVLHLERTRGEGPGGHGAEDRNSAISPALVDVTQDLVVTRRLPDAERRVDEGAGRGRRVVERSGSASRRTLASTDPSETQDVLFSAER